MLRIQSRHILYSLVSFLFGLVIIWTVYCVCISVGMSVKVPNNEATIALDSLKTTIDSIEKTAKSTPTKHRQILEAIVSIDMIIAST